MNSLIALAERGAESHGKTVEEADTQRQRQLLTCHRVNHALEDRGEARRLHALEALGQGSQLSVVHGELVEFRQADAEPQQPLQGRCHGDPNCGTDRLARHRDFQSRRLGRRHLGDCHLHRPGRQWQHPSVGCAVPAIHDVVRTTAQRPDRQVQAERRCRLQFKGVAGHVTSALLLDKLLADRELWPLG